MGEIESRQRKTVPVSRPGVNFRARFCFPLSCPPSLPSTTLTWIPHYTPPSTLLNKSPKEKQPWGKRNWTINYHFEPRKGGKNPSQATLYFTLQRLVVAGGKEKNVSIRFSHKFKIEGTLIAAAKLPKYEKSENTLSRRKNGGGNGFSNFLFFFCGKKEVSIAKIWKTAAPDVNSTGKKAATNGRRGAVTN